MVTIEIRDGGLATQDPSDARVYRMTWEDNLAAGVTFTTNTFTVTQLSGTATPALTRDSVSADGLDTIVRLSGGAEGGLYRIDNLVITNESPAQTKERHFKVLVQTK